MNEQDRATLARVRDDIAKAMFRTRWHTHTWKEISQARKNEWLGYADAILAIKGVVVLSDDQREPNYPDAHTLNAMVRRDTMLKDAGFKKVNKVER